MRGFAPAGYRFRVATIHAPALAVCIACGFLLSGCAGLRGVQQQVDASDLTSTVCPAPAEIAAFESPDDKDRILPPNRAGLTPEAYRNAVINNCITAANNKFTAYTSSLRQEATGAKLGVDLAILTLAGLGAVGNGARNAAAATQGLVGAGAAIDKDIYFDQTLPALVAAMGVNRNLILRRISDNEKLSATEYSLRDASNDFWALQNASSIDAAINQMVTLAKTAESVTGGQIPTTITVGLLEQPVQDRKVKLRKAIDAIYGGGSGNRNTLDLIAHAIGLPPDNNPADTKLVHDNIVFSLDQQIQTQSDMDRIAALLAPYVGLGM